MWRHGPNENHSVTIQMENWCKKDENSSSNSNENSDGKLIEEGCRRPIMGENVETGSQTGCHYPISHRRQIVQKRHY